MNSDDHVAYSLRYRRECISQYVIYWDTMGYIIRAFNTDTDTEVERGTPDRFKMQHVMLLVREKEYQRRYLLEKSNTDI